MKKVTILSNQSLQDLSIQLTGDISNCLAIAKFNNIDPSKELKAGDSINIPEGLVNDEDILRYYRSNEILPATSLNQNDIDNVKGCEGIECWALGIDFQVS